MIQHTQTRMEYDLEAERSAIARMGSLHRVHWIVVALSLLLTLGAWYITSSQIEARVAGRFERGASQVLELVSERMQKYEDGLWGGVAAVQAAGGSMSYDQWRSFSSSLHIETKYPGINGIGIIYSVSPAQLDEYLALQRIDRPDFHIHPPHDMTEYFPITYVEPAAANAAAIGLDMAHEINRLTAMRKARDTGGAQITAPIVLVQDAEHTPGFLFAVPFYNGGPQSSIEDRRAELTGLVYAPFVFHKLIEGVLGKENRLVRFSISDGDQMLYDEFSTQPANHRPEFIKHVDLDLYGRTWTFTIWDGPEFQTLTSSNEPTMILVGGIFIDTMLLMLFVILARSNRRALEFSDRMTEELKSQASSLSRSNKELEQFAYVTSHDLKTPLRGIGYLIDYLKEDLDPLIKGPDDTREIETNLERLQSQLRRMENLIAGILEYSSIREAGQTLTRVDTLTLARDICRNLDLRPDQFVFEGLFPTLTTDAVRLEQVLGNLIGNACKYHESPDEALITISAQDAGDRVRFTVADNGPGIEPRFHTRIFEIFQTLRPKDELESTGIGLSIVKKAVELYGGTVDLKSAHDAGTAISFDWPKHIEPETEQKKAA